MFIPDPGYRFLPIPDPGSRISDPGSKNSKRREELKKNFCHTFLCSHKFHKIENYFSFEVLNKKIWANFQRIIELFTQKIVIKLSKRWVWDPGSGKNLFRIPDPGVKKAPDTGSRIRIRNTANEVKSYYTTAICRARLFKSKFRLAMEFSSLGCKYLPAHLSTPYRMWTVLMIKRPSFNCLIHLYKRFCI
jgi:hypothetical protein